MDNGMIGVIPRWLWLEQRARSLSEAIGRYIDHDVAGRPVVVEWANELVVILTELRDRKTPRET